MSKKPWIFCSSIPKCGNVELPLEELRHLVGSHRRRLGESLVVFDGAGNVAQAKLQDIEKKPLRGWAKIISTEYHMRSTRKMRLASALPKGDRQGLMLELVTQLGITDFIPLLCARSIARPGRRGYERWERVLIETCKQCQRPWVPDLHPETTITSLLNGKKSTKETVILADEEGKSATDLDLNYGASDQLLLVGPEGGFSSEERRYFLKNGALAVRLSENNLRIEAAAVALVSLVSR